MITLHIVIMSIFFFMIVTSPGSRLTTACNTAPTERCDVTFGDAIADWGLISSWVLPSVFTVTVKSIIFIFFMVTFGFYIGILLKDPGIRHPLLMNTTPTDPSYHYPLDLPSNIDEMRASLVARNPKIRLRNAVRGWTYDNVYFFCEDCGIWAHKNEDVEHCDDCDVCIFGHDHHCPWTSKCIGRDNFVNFVMWITLVLASIGIWTYGVISLKEPS